MNETANTGVTSAVAMHSGAYVARYNVKPLDRVRALAKRIRIGPNSRIADFGCGNGMLLQVLEGTFGSYDGVDFSADFIASANAWAKRSGKSSFRFHLSDIRGFSAAHPNEFDIAATLDFSEHIEDLLATEIYASIRGTLRPGGILYLHTPNLDFFVERAKTVGIIRQFPEHVAVRSGPQMVNLLVKAGFERKVVVG